jgi:hypothetical protein
MSLFIPEVEEGLQWSDLPRQLYEPEVFTVDLPSFFEVSNSDALTMVFSFDDDERDRLLFTAPTPGDEDRRAQVLQAAFSLGVYDESSRYLVMLNDAWKIEKEAAEEVLRDGISRVSQHPERFEVAQMMVLDMQQPRIQIISMAYARAEGGFIWDPLKSSSTAVHDFDPDAADGAYGGRIVDFYASAVLDRSRYWRLTEEKIDDYLSFFDEFDEAIWRKHTEVAGMAHILRLTNNASERAVFGARKDLSELMRAAQRALLGADRTAKKETG